MPRLLRGKQERVYVEFRDREGALRNVDTAFASVYDKDGNLVVDEGGTTLENRPMRRTRTGVYNLSIQFATGQTVGNFYLWAEGNIQEDLITLDFPITLELVAVNFIPTETLCSMEYVKRILRIEDTTEDSYLYDLLLAADARVKDYCRRTFWTTTFTEYHSGEGGSSILLAEWPVTTLTSITDDGAAIDSDDYTWNANGFVQLLENNEWSSVENGVCVVYIAGYSTIPENVQMATARLTGFWRSMEGRDGLRSERIGDDYTYTRDTESLKTGIPGIVRDLLRDEKRVY